MTLPANINCANAFSNEGLREISGRICLVLFCSITIAAPDSCFCTMFCECSMLAFKLSKCHIFLFITLYSHCVGSLKKIIFVCDILIVH